MAHPTPEKPSTTHLDLPTPPPTGLTQSFLTNPRASLWCIYAIWCIILLSFDSQAGGSVVGIPEFRKDFGYEYDGSYVLPAAWQSSFNGAPVAVAVVAALVAAEVADIVGRKVVLLAALIISCVGVVVEFVAITNAVFFAGKLLNGIMIGSIGTVMISYIGEISPLALRGLFTCCVGVAYGIGPLVAFIVINYTGQVTSRWAYRSVFCAQWGFAAVALAFYPWMPESPWWLMTKGRKDAALKSLHSLGYTDEKGLRQLEIIQTTLDEIASETTGVTYLECLRQSNLRRTIVSMMPLIIQALSGIVFVASYFTYYLQMAGYSTKMSYRLQIAQPVLSIIGNLTAAVIIDRIGRRNLTFYGLIILTIFLLITGGLAMSESPTCVKGTVAFILIYSWWYNVSIGSSSFPLLCETATSRLRVKTIAIGYAVQNAINVMWQFVLPYLFNPDRANLGAKIAFIFSGLCLLSLVYLWYCQPETGGRSYQELDEMFAKGVPARQFKTYKTDSQVRTEIYSAKEKV